MDKSFAVAALEEIGRLMEIQGENPFRCNAYHNAARALEMFEGDFEALLLEGRLTELRGIGKGLAETITHLVTSGRLPELDALRAKTPPGLLDMLEIPGFGPKKARAVFESLGIASLDALEAACRDGRVAALKGFGEKSQAKILEGIAQLRRGAGLFRADVARAAAEPLLRALAEHPDVIRAEIAGSLRRWKEVVHDIDLLAATRAPEKVMDFFTRLPGAESVIAAGASKSSVRLKGGLQADLRCVTEAQFPFALHYFTGSKEHNTALRARAKKRGLKLNEYGLFPEDSEESLACADEAALFAALGLGWIAPELREDLGEIDAAAEGRLPRLVEAGDLRAIFHMHTNASDGAPTLSDYAAWAEARGVALMGIADHSRSAAYARGLSAERVIAQRQAIDELNARRSPTAPGRLLKGIESDILADGSLDYDEDLLAGFDFIVASVHSRFQMPREEMTRRVCRAIEHPRTTILGHPTGRLLLRREGYAIDLNEVIECAARRGVAIEINANPHRLDLDWRWARVAIEKGALLCIGPDAHDLDGLDDTRFGLGAARKAWAEPRHILNAWPPEKILAWLSARRAAA